jgi:hypothetical protein
MCKIYNSQANELSKQDSCTNIKALENMVCPIASATKDVVSVANNPALLRCTYIPPNGSSQYMPVNCFDIDRYELYFNSVMSSLGPSKLALMNSEFRKAAETNVAFCPASKAYYIDRTLQNPIGAGSCESNKFRS